MGAAVTIGVDIAKSLFQVHGVDAAGAPVLKRQLKRAQMMKFFGDLPPALIGIEAGGTATTGLVSWPAVDMTLGLDPYSGAAIVFRAKRADRIKILVWDRTGLVLVHKRRRAGSSCGRGFVSTVCWPLSAYLVAHLGWRGTCFAYAAIQLLVSLPIILMTLPKVPPELPKAKLRGGGPVVELLPLERDAFRVLSGTMIIGGAIGAIVGVHLLTLLQGQGIGLAAAVAFGALIGPAQVGGRVIEMVGGGRHRPIWTMSVALGLIAFGLAMLSFEVGPIALALIFYGAGNGVFSIAKGTLPLAPFGPQRYAPLVGKLARSSLIAQALAPTAGALLIEKGGSSWTYMALLLLGLANACLGASLWSLEWRKNSSGPCGKP